MSISGIAMAVERTDWTALWRRGGMTPADLGRLDDLVPNRDHQEDHETRGESEAEQGGSHAPGGGDRTRR